MGRRQDARLNKKSNEARQKEGMKHDGQNFSLLAEGRLAGIPDTEIFIKFFDFVKLCDAEGWENKSHDGFSVLINKESGRTYMLKAVGLPDGTQPGNVRLFDFHINLHIREDYLSYVKQQQKN